MTNKHIPIAWVSGVPIPSLTEYQRRRANLFAALPDQSAVLIFSSPEVLRNGDDNTYTYRQSSDFLYLSGFPEASSVLVLTKKKGKGRFVMFVGRQDMQSEIWHGKRIGLEGAKKLFGADYAYSTTTLGGTLPRFLKGIKHVYLGQGTDPALEAKAKRVISRLKLKGRISEKPSAADIISELRLVKSPAELAIMHHSAQVAAAAHTEALKACRPGLAECDLKAVIEHVYTAAGNFYPSYDTIVADGPNGLSLHHPAGTAALNDGHLVLVDAGCEVSGYASDITRTYPVNGRFTAAQKEIYEVVLAGQIAAIETVKAGATWSDLDKACSTVLTAGLTALGFKLGTKSKGALTLDELMPHGLGHWLGLDVHDVGHDEIEVKDAAGRSKKCERPLVAAMVLTIEPGLYLSRTDKRIPAKYRGIAVRIEDDVVVTEGSACNVLTAGVAKTVETIESLMSAARRSEK